jgi:hypothetical protein
MSKAKDPAVMIALETRLTKAQADSLATRIPRLRKMLASGVLFFRDTLDREDFDAALERIGKAIAASTEPFEVTDWPPRPVKVGKPRLGRAIRKGDPSFFPASTE